MQDEARRALDQLTHLTVLVDLWAEEDGDTIYRSLERIVHALAEATAYISPRAVAVDRGEQAEAVDDDAGCALRQTLRFVILGEADGRALEPRFDSPQVLLVDLMRCQDQGEVLGSLLIEVRQEDSFVLGPRATDDQEATATRELRYRRDILRCTGDLLDTVKACIPCDLDRLDTMLQKKRARSLVLHVETAEEVQQAQVPASVATEEELVGAEDRRDEVGRDRARSQLAEHRRPEVVLDEDSYRRVRQIKEAAHR